MRFSVRLALALLVCGLAFSSCGSSETDPEAIRLQANAVGGGQVFYDDLASEDTVLWFWAPW